MKTISHEPRKSLASIIDYWTEERRINASPKHLPILQPDSNSDNQDERFSSQPPVLTPPNTSINNKLKSNNKNLSPLATPVDNPEEFPYRCNGKLFFNWKGRDYVGSAGSIYLEVLLTAAHNIYDEGEWSDNFLYYPAYPDYGKSWGWSRAAIFTAWKNDTNFSYDYAMLLTNSSMKEVGSIGTILDIPPTARSWTAYGYPAGTPYAGKQMYETTGDYISGNTIITMNNNDMTQGSSGGNWITNYSGKNYVNGVQSTRGDKPTYANSPYLASIDFNDLLKCVTTGNCH